VSALGLCSNTGCGLSSSLGFGGSGFSGSLRCGGSGFSGSLRFGFGLLSFSGGSFAGQGLLLLADDFGVPNGLGEQATLLKQRPHRVGGLGALAQSSADRLGFEPGFLGAGVVEAQLFKGTTVPAGGAVGGHEAEARFPLLTEPLQAELDHRS
jgi:hypothetical protein